MLKSFYKLNAAHHTTHHCAEIAHSFIEVVCFHSECKCKPFFETEKENFEYLCGKA
jgi:hypothetical protein